MNKISHLFESSILRAYDIRGVINETLFEKDAFMIGFFFGLIAKKKSKKKLPKIILSRDGRNSGPALKKQTVLGLLKSGCHIIDIGLNPTPALYFGNEYYNCDGAIQITGSHNPKNFNGFKLIMDNKPFFGNDIQDLGALAKIGSNVNNQGVLINKNLEDTYINELLKPVRDFHNLETLKIIWDCGNGATGNVIEKLVKKLPGKHFVLYSKIDGNFPNHHPDPSREENLKVLKKNIIKEKADYGFAFDGDGDRLGVLDSKGNLMSGDMLTAFLAQSIRDKSNPIIIDVKSSLNCQRFLENLNFKVIVWKTGHSHIKEKMKQTKSEFAGEMSGHIFFSDDYFGYDDAIYSSIRFLSLINQKFTLKNFYSNVGKSYATPEIKIYCSEDKKFQIIKELTILIKKKYQTKYLNLIDGIRVNLDYGWYLIRASNTESSIIIRIDGKTTQNLVDLKNEVRDFLKIHDLTF